MIGGASHYRTGGWAGVILLAGLAGCQPEGQLPSPGRLTTERDPILNSIYHQYVPSSYGPERAWPLVVVCHGSPPLDSARRQADLWKGPAEQQGFIVAAPELTGAAILEGDVEARIARQARDEQAVVSIVQAVRAARSIDENRIFLAGFGSGCYSTLYTGLRHPDIFRAVSLAHGNFDAERMAPCVPLIDPYQQILVLYGSTDLLKEQARSCLDWLRSNGMDPEPLQRAGFHAADPQPVIQFFTQVIRQHPFIRIEVEDDARDAMRVTFRTRSSFQPLGIQWDFGDQHGSTDPTPVHEYAEAGVYTVRVALWAPGRKRYVRRTSLQMPRVRLGTPLPPAPTP